MASSFQISKANVFTYKLILKFCFTFKLIYDADFKKPTAIIMGSEENGISGEYLKRSDVQVKIPMTGNIASLNVSVATGVVLFEVVHQRL